MEIASGTTFMDQRMRKQDIRSNPELDQAERCYNPVSKEISRLIEAGNFKHCKLQTVLTDPKFRYQAENQTQRDSSMTGMHPLNQDLMEKIMSNQKDHHRESGISPL